jgi:hypothetical protein
MRLSGDMSARLSGRTIRQKLHASDPFEIPLPLERKLKEGFERSSLIPPSWAISSINERL